MAVRRIVIQNHILCPYRMYCREKINVWRCLQVRSGVKRLRVIDFDQVSLSSLNRHAVATWGDVGYPKVWRARLACVVLQLFKTTGVCLLCFGRLRCHRFVFSICPCGCTPVVYIYTTLGLVCVACQYLFGRSWFEQRLVRASQRTGGERSPKMNR